MNSNRIRSVYFAMSITNSIQTIQQHSPDDRKTLLGFLLSYKMKLVIELFWKRGIKINRKIKKYKLAACIKMLLDTDKIDLNDIFSILIELEGWGRQQIYLYKFKGGNTLQNQWLDKDWVESHLKQNGMDETFNAIHPITTSNQSPLFSIDRGSIRFIWVQNRITAIREESRDPVPPEFKPNEESTAFERIIYRAYRETVVRDITSFEWNVKSGEVMLMIRKLTGTDYKAVHDKILSELADILPINDFQPLSISKLVKNLNLANNDEVMIRKAEFKSIDNNGTILVASGNQKDVSEDRILEQSRIGFIKDVNGLRSNIRWKVNEKKNIGIELYAKKSGDQRIGITSQELEKDVRHVLRRIRTYCT